MAGPDPGIFSILLRGDTTRTSYQIARDTNNEYIHEIVGTGRELREEWDFRNPSDGMGETVRHAPNSNGEMYTINIDTTTRGLRLSPSVNGASNASLSLSGVGTGGSRP